MFKTNRNKQVHGIRRDKFKVAEETDVTVSQSFLKDCGIQIFLIVCRKQILYPSSRMARMNEKLVSLIPASGNWLGNSKHGQIGG